MTFNLDQFGNGPDDDQYPVDAFVLIEVEYDASGNFYEAKAIYLDRKAANDERDRLNEVVKQHGRHYISYTVWETELVRGSEAK